MDVIIYTSYNLEDFAYQDYICATNLLSADSLVLGSISTTKNLTFIVSSVTVVYRSVKYYTVNIMELTGVLSGYGTRNKKGNKIYTKKY